MDMSTINWWAVLVAALSCFALGSIWYAPPVFGTAWIKESGVDMEKSKNANMVKLFGLAFLTGLVASANLAMFLNDPKIGLQEGAMYGFFTGFGWVGMFLGMNYLYEQKSFKLWLINAGYSTVALTIMGIILGAWK